MRCTSRPASTTRPATPGARPSQRPATRARSRPPGAATTSNPSRTKFTGATLLGAATGKDRGNGQDEDLEVEPGRPILHVIVVPLDPVGKRHVAAQALDLRPAGEAGLHAMAIAVAIDALGERGDEVDALRAGPDERHVAARQIDDLRQLVERPAPQEAAGRGPPVDER